MPAKMFGRNISQLQEIRKALINLSTAVAKFDHALDSTELLKIDAAVNPCSDGKVTFSFWTFLSKKLNTGRAMICSLRQNVPTAVRSTMCSEHFYVFSVIFVLCWTPNHPNMSSHYSIVPCAYYFQLKSW